MKAEDFKVGERVIVTGPIYHGREGRVRSIGNGTVFVLGKFSKGRKDASFPRGFAPEHLAPLMSDRGQDVLYAKTVREVESRDTGRPDVSQ